MGTIDLNFGKVGALPPEGDILFRITAADVKPAKDQSKAPNIVVDLVIAEHEDSEWVNWKLRQWLNLGEASLWKTQEFLEAATGQDWRDDSMALDPSDLVNLELIGQCVHSEDNNGKPSLNVKTWLKA